MNLSLDTDWTGIGEGNNDSAHESFSSSSGDNMLIDPSLEWRIRCGALRSFRLGALRPRLRPRYEIRRGGREGGRPGKTGGPPARGGAARKRPGGPRPATAARVH